MSSSDVGGCWSDAALCDPPTYNDGSTQLMWLFELALYIGVGIFAVFAVLVMVNMVRSREV